MIKFFRNIRQNLLNQGKTKQYFKYAIGEILLVVIGILIALQINNWNEDRKRNILEARYVSDLIQDIKQDSVNLEQILADLNELVSIKEPLLEMIRNESGNADTVLIHFQKIYSYLILFTPNRTTFDEMTSSSSLDIISNTELRRSVIELYAKYNSLNKLEEAAEYVRLDLARLLKKNVPNLNSPKVEDIYALKDNVEVMNSILLNFSNTRYRNYYNTFQFCAGILQMLSKESKK